MIRLEFTSERIKSSLQKDNPSRRILGLTAASWHFRQNFKKIENLRRCLTDYVKKMSALLSFYGGHLTLDKKTISEFFPLYISDNRWLRWPREKTTRDPTKYQEALSKIWPKFNISRPAKFLRCRFTSSALLLNAKIGISTMARIAFENRAKKTIINVPTPC